MPNPTPSDIDVNALLRSRGQVAHIWGTDDVKAERPDLTDDQAMAVLDACLDNLDSNYGFTWGLLRDTAQDLFPTTGEQDEANRLLIEAGE